MFVGQFDCQWICCMYIHGENPGQIGMYALQFMMSEYNGHTIKYMNIIQVTTFSYYVLTGSQT